MNNIKGVLREGWHPKGTDGGRESWRGDFKGVNQVVRKRQLRDQRPMLRLEADLRQAGWVGKGKNPNNSRSASGAGSDRISRPLTTLKDPASFGPPPKNVHRHGGAALPSKMTPDRRGLGAPLPSTHLETAGKTAHGAEEAEYEQPPKPAGPPVPYRVNRTGLRTDHLPPPLLHRAAECENGNGNGNGNEQEKGIVCGALKAKPSLPPRLPSRDSSSILTSPVASSSPPPEYDFVADDSKRPANTYFNQGALDRLSKAGITVQGLGIGPNTTAAPTESSPTISPPASHLSRLQSHISETQKTSTPPQSVPSPSHGTTLAQKQAALKTAQSFQRNPSSVSVSDARSAATTANNFRERHQDQIAAGAQKANTLNKKYNITGRMNSFLEQQVSPADTSTQQPATQHSASDLQQTPNISPQTLGLKGRKPAPPLPPKKPSSMYGKAMDGQAPPPVPLGTKPSFG